MPRMMEIATPFTGDNALLFYRMHGREEMSRPSEYQIELLAKEEAVVDFDQILGENVTITLALPDESTRFFNGFVSRFSYGGRHGRYLKFHAVVKPWFWFLTKTSDCRIFQEMTVPDIVKKVFEDHPDADFKLELMNSYRTWDYCVQYRETDFNFVSRLLEHEGIFYYFRHTNGHHKMILTDDVSKLNASPGYEIFRFIDPKDFVRPEIEHVRRWDYSREVQPGKYVHTDYDLKRPSVDLKTEKMVGRGYGASEYEIFDYPGAYLQHADGEATANVRIWELGSQFEAAHALTNSRGVEVGALFTLENCPRADQNCEHFIVAADYDLQFSDYEGIPEPEPTHYDCNFTAMTSQQQFRPRRVTPKPFVQGPQTAVVVGPAGDEIYTDEFGRVKVKFRWDRDPQKNEKSSCWIRVSHPWAGKGWGAMAIPRIGQEVIVDFLEGDPDQPIITGRVYNAEAMPPYALPANATQSGLVSRSSPGGNGFNEIRMEDSKDKEQLSIHAQKDMSTQVERDQSVAIGRDQSSVVKRNQSLAVTVDRSIHVKNNESHIVDVDQNLKVGANQFNEIVGNQTSKVTGVYTQTVKGAINTDTQATRVENTKGNEQRTIGGNLTVNVTGNIGYKAAKMTFEAGHIEHNVTGSSSVVHSSPNGPYSIMANKFSVMSNTDASILAVGKINYTSIESNTTVMGPNTSGYIGHSSATAMGLARSTFLGLSVNTFMGMQISSTLAIQIESVAAVKISASAGPHLELAALKIHQPGGGGGGGGALTLAADVAKVAQILGVLTGASVFSAGMGFKELWDQYDAARKELAEASAAAAAAGHPGLAARLARLSQVSVTQAGAAAALGEGPAPTSTQDDGTPPSIPSSGSGSGTPPPGGSGGTPPPGGGGGTPPPGGSGGTPPPGGSGGTPPPGGSGGTPPPGGSGGTPPPGSSGGTPPPGGSGGAPPPGGSGGAPPPSGGTPPPSGDAGPPDGGVPSGGSSADSAGGPPDAGVPPPDAGVPPPAGVDDGS